jgi:hypothetical protein
MGSMQRTKGHTWEREVAAMFRAIWPDARRGLTQSRAGDEDADVMLPRFWVECKAMQRVNIEGAFRQATEASRRSGKIPLVCSKSNRREPLATLPLKDFVAILFELEEAKKAAPYRSEEPFDASDYERPFPAPMLLVKSAT